MSANFSSWQNLITKFTQQNIKIYQTGNKQMFGKTQEKVINLNLIAKYPEFPELPQIRLNFDIKQNKLDRLLEKADKLIFKKFGKHPQINGLLIKNYKYCRIISAKNHLNYIQYRHQICSITDGQVSLQKGSLLQRTNYYLFVSNRPFYLISILLNSLIKIDKFIFSEDQYQMLTKDVYKHLSQSSYKIKTQWVQLAIDIPKFEQLSIQKIHCFKGSLFFGKQFNQQNVRQWIIKHNKFFQCSPIGKTDLQQKLIVQQQIQQLRCPISYSLIKFPVITQCLHTFDYMSIQKWLLQNSTCPICRSQVSITKIQIDIPKLFRMKSIMGLSKHYLI